VVGGVGATGAASWVVAFFTAVFSAARDVVVLEEARRVLVRGARGGGVSVEVTAVSVGGVAGGTAVVASSFSTLGRCCGYFFYASRKRCQHDYPRRR
jgi:hypothetical protein